MPTNWIVLYCRNARFWSCRLTERNRDALSQVFYLSLIQRDASGTEHYDILAVRKGADRKARQLVSHMD